jgi:hypothetical protein
MKKILLLCLLFSFFVFSQHFEYKVYDPSIPGFAKVNIDNVIAFKEEIEQNHVICEGNTTDIDLLINKEVTYRDLELSTLCYFDAGAHNTLTCWEVGDGPGGGGYWKRSSPNSGQSVIISESIKNQISSGLQGAFTYNSAIPLYENIIKKTSYARLSKFNLFQEGNDINAEGRIGVGCLGTYNYKVDGPGTSKTFTGTLDNAQANYKFDKIGNYKITFTTSVNNCLVVYEEKYKDKSGKIQKLIHRFIEPTKQTPRKTTEILNVQVVNSDGPTYTQPEGNVNCGLSYTGGIIFLPPSLVEGQNVIIPVYMTITNPFDVPIYINGINHKYKVEKYIGWGSSIYLDTNDITSKIKKSDPCISKTIKTNPLGQIICGPLKIEPNQVKTIQLDVESELVVDEPLDSYYLTVGFDYYYNKPSHGCYEAGSGTGYCPASINVDVIDEPEILKSYSLNANVDYEENIIDREFIEKEKKTVNIFGRVNLTTNDGGTSPIITTQWIGGADVELVSLEIQGTNIDCLKTKGLKTKTAQLNAPPYSYTGNYRFDDVELNAVCLEYDIIDSLVAGIKVDYTTTDGVPLTNNFDGDIPIDTTLPTLACNINYKMAGSSYKPGEGTEEYNVTVLIENEIKLDKIIYTCGNEEDEETENLGEDENEFTFMCEYNFEAGNEDEIFRVQAQVWDEIGPRNTTCVVDIGLCYPYI